MPRPTHVCPLKWHAYQRPSNTDDHKLVPVFMFSSRNDEMRNLLSKNDLIQMIRTTVHDRTLGEITVGNWIGHDYISMEWKDVRFFWLAMGALLHVGISVTTQSRLPVSLPARYIRTGERLTPAIAERMQLQHLESTQREYVAINDGVDVRTGTALDPEKESAYITRSLCNNTVYRHYSSWSSDDGRKIVEHVRKAHGLPVAMQDSESSDEGDVTVKRPRHPSDSPSPPESPPKRAKTATSVVDLTAEPTVVEPDTCMICMDLPADTLVLPCGHVVVCRACSVRLRDTNDALICCACRCPIGEILVDE